MSNKCWLTKDRHRLVPASSAGKSAGLGPAEMIRLLELLLGGTPYHLRSSGNKIQFLRTMKVYAF